MNITDLAFKYHIDIDFDGDFDGGNYYLKLNYLTSTQSGITETETKLSLKQDDIDCLYSGAVQLIKKLEKYVTEHYK